MTDDDKALVQRLREDMADVKSVGYYNDELRDIDAACDRIEAQAAEIERLQERNAELHGQLMRMIDRWEQQRAALEARGLEIRSKNDGQ